MTVFTVSNQTQLDSALTQLKGGDTLQLAAGAYSMVMTSKAFASNVTITSVDPADPARLSWLKLTDTSNVTFKNLDIGRTLGSTETPDSILARVSGGGNLTFDTVHFHGSLDDNPKNDGTGINFGGGVVGIKIVNSEFEQLGRGATIGGARDIVILNNNFHDIRSDGLDFAQVNNVLIEGNSFTDFYRTSTDHPDGIQFWTTNTTRPSTDIVIRNNVMLQGSGDAIQGIFMRDELGTLPYERVTIENNLVYQQYMSNGITVMGGKDINITGNSVLSPVDDTVKVWIRAEAIQGGTITKNLTDYLYLGGNTSLTVTDNLLTSQSGLSSTLLSLSSTSTMNATQLLVNGYGYQLPVTSGSTTTTTTNPSTTSTTPITTTTTDTSSSSSGTTTTDSGGGTTTTTKPGKGRGKKSALTSKSAITTSTSDLYAYSFSAGTLSDTLPEVQSSHGLSDPGSLVTRKARSSGSLAKLQPKAGKFAAEAFLNPATSGFEYRMTLLASR